LLAATFLALGLAAGYFAHDRAQALIIGVSAWLLLLSASICWLSSRPAGAEFRRCPIFGS